MGTTQPIRSKKNIEMMKKYFLERGEVRNYTLFTVGINVPLRISDLLALQWKDVYNFRISSWKEHINVIEKKTGKKNMLALNSTAVGALKKHWKHIEHPVLPEEYIFTAQNHWNKSISRVSAYLIIHNAAEELGIADIGCHSLRKTFGYHAWKKGVHIALIMSIYNHSSVEITKRYLCIEQIDKDDVFRKMNLQTYISTKNKFCQHILNNRACKNVITVLELTIDTKC